MNIEIYLELYAETKSRPVHYFSMHHGKPFHVNDYDKEITTPGVIPFSVASVIVSMVHISERMTMGDRDTDERTESNVILILDESSYIKVSSRFELFELKSGDESYGIPLSYDERPQFFEYISRHADKKAAKMFNRGLANWNLPNEILQHLTAKFNPVTDLSAIEERKEKHLNLLGSEIRKRFEDFDVSDPVFFYENNTAFVDFILTYKEEETPPLSILGKIISEMETKMDGIFIETPANLDLTHYQWLRHTYFYTFDVSNANGFSFIIKYSLWFQAYSNEAYFKNSGPGYYEAFLDNTCSGRFDREGLEVLVDYSEIPFSDDLAETC
jgi:hypothetical protein